MLGPHGDKRRKLMWPPPADPPQGASLRFTTTPTTPCRLTLGPVRPSPARPCTARASGPSAVDLVCLRSVFAL